LKMVTKKELEQNVKALKRKLEEREKKVTAFEKKLEEREKKVKACEKKMCEKEEELDSSKRRMDEQEEELDSSRSKMNKLENILQKLEDKVECPVCLDVPRSAPVPVCPNGHIVCEKCTRFNCPTCRCVMGAGKSILAGTVIENIKHKCKFNDCNKTFALEDLETHEVVCLHRTVNCPYRTCPMKIPIAQLVDHLKSSETCGKGNVAPMIAENWYCRIYRGVVSKQSISWSIPMYSYCGEILAIYPIKSKGQFFFVIVMFASEFECSKYKFEMIVHESEKKTFESEDAVKFQGSPLSIDVKKEELKLYGSSEQLMSKILRKSTDKNSFGLSFKISTI